MIVNKHNLSIECFDNAQVIKTHKSDAIKRKNHLKFVLDQLMINGEILEFGVYEGRSLKRISEKFPNQTIYGFDSFEGLPEEWTMTLDERRSGVSNHPKGHFDTSHLQYNFLPNVKLVKGFFEDSLPKWIKNNKLKNISLLHIDSDLYSSAKTIFDNLDQYIVKGTIIIFDELYPWGNYKKYELWQEGEWKALVEWVNQYDRQFEVISRNEHQQCAIRIL